MVTKIKHALIGGIVGTIVMSLIMMLSPIMGIPKMSPPDMLAMMMGFPTMVGWVMHFMIGVIFAMIYAFFFINLVKRVSSNFLKGIIYGMATFIFAQLMMAILGMMIPMPPMEGNMLLMMVGSLIGHIIFGITVVVFAKEKE